MEFPQRKTSPTHTPFTQKRKEECRKATDVREAKNQLPAKTNSALTGCSDFHGPPGIFQTYFYFIFLRFWENRLFAARSIMKFPFPTSHSFDSSSARYVTKSQEFFFWKTVCMWSRGNNLFFECLVGMLGKRTEGGGAVVIFWQKVQKTSFSPRFSSFPLHPHKKAKKREKFVDEGMKQSKKFFYNIFDLKSPSFPSFPTKMRDKNKAPQKYLLPLSSLLWW